jgi:hypothetical protein
MARKLKTYQTSLGFFDLAGAAPSRRLRLVDGLLPAFTLFLPGGLLPRPFKFAALLFPLIGERCLSPRRLVDRARGSLLRLTVFRLAGGFRRTFAVA